MSGLARLLLARGAHVTGSDAKDSRTLAALAALGAEVFVGHHPDHLGAARTVVVSSAIRDTNPELVAARDAGLAVLPRAACLAELMKGHRGVTVAGAHGKTTTTSMLAVALLGCHADPSFAIGGDLNEVSSNAHHGLGELFVVEADESDGSFLLFEPDAAVVTNVEADHLDHYGDMAAVTAAFDAFADRVSPAGFLVCCADDPGAARLASRARRAGRDVRTYGVAAEADLRLEALTTTAALTSYQAVLRGVRLGEVRLRVVGEHNARNSAAALATGIGLGYPFAALAAALSEFTGVRRRFELKGHANGVRVYDDYAHHPSEVQATLAAARVVAGEGRLVVAFQPHLYSRTAAFADELGRALAAADEVVVCEVYGAREDPIPGISGALVAAAVPLPAEQVTFVPSWSAVPEELARRARPGDVVLTIGAGDVTLLGAEVLALLAGDRPERAPVG